MKTHQFLGRWLIYVLCFLNYEITWKKLLTVPLKELWHTGYLLLLGKTSMVSLYSKSVSVVWCGWMSSYCSGGKASWPIEKAQSNQKCIHCLITLYVNLNQTISPECFLMDKEKQKRKQRRRRWRRDRRMGQIKKTDSSDMMRGRSEAVRESKQDILKIHVDVVHLNLQ